MARRHIDKKGMVNIPALSIQNSSILNLQSLVAGAFETKQVFDIAPNIVNTDIVSTLAPQRKFQPLGYVGDPANYLVAPGIETVSAWAEYYAKSILSSMPVTSVQPGSNQALPKESELLQNYPNPFNPTTTMEFTVPEDGRVSLKIYNMIGQLVATLFDGDVKAGYTQKTIFDASQLSSGVYFSRLQFNDKSLMQKIVLMK